MTRSLTPIIGITILAQLFIFLLGLSNNVILSRWLGPEMLGVLATIIVLIEIIFKIANPGIDSSAIYFISNKRFPFNKFIGNYILNGFVIFLFGVMLLIMLLQSKILYILSDKIDIQVIVENYWGLILFLFAFQFYEFGTKITLGLQRFSRFNKAQMIKSAILFLLLIGCYFLFRAELWLVLVVYSLSWIIPSIFLWRIALPFKFRWEKEITVQSVRYGIKIMAANLLMFLTYRADIILIGFFLSQTAVGWYYVSVLVAEKLLLLTQATGTILFPAASSSIEQSKKAPLLSRVNLFFVIIGAIIIAATSFWIIPLLFSIEYSNSVMPLIILLPGIAALSVSKILSADFGARGKPQYSMYVSIINFCLNITLNIIFIPELGIKGAAISSSISYSIAAAIQCYLYKKITGTPVTELIFIRPDDFKSVLKI